MPLKPFTYPLPETRFLHAGTSVYKFKIKYGSNINGEEVENKESIVRELEEAIRAVLPNLHNLQPFATKNLIIFPYKSKWERVSKLRFKHNNMFLFPFPYVCTMYVESNSATKKKNFNGKTEKRGSVVNRHLGCHPVHAAAGSETKRSHSSEDIKQLHLGRDVREVAVKRRRVEEPAESNVRQSELKRNASALSCHIGNDTQFLKEFEMRRRSSGQWQHFEGGIYSLKSRDQTGNYAYITAKKRKEHELELQQSQHASTMPCSESKGGRLLQFISRSVNVLWHLFSGKRLP